MTLTLTFAWWWIGVAMILIGALMAAVSPVDRCSGGMFSFDTPGPAGCFGICLFICGVLYLVFGGIARLFA